MKFGKQFDFHKIPEWSEYYLDYNYLKDLLKKLKKQHLEGKFEGDFNEKFLNKEDAINIDNSSLENITEEAKKKDSNLVEISSTNEDLNYNCSLIEEKADLIQIKDNKVDKKFYFEQFIEKLNIIEKFFNTELLSLSKDFTKLKNKMNDKRTSMIEVDPKKKTKKDLKSNIEKENAERDELGFAVSWKRAFSQLYNLTSWLHSYCTINIIACQKIVKKSKKVFQEEKIENVDVELTEFYINLNFVKKLEDVIKLRKEIKIFYANELADGNYLTAKIELERRMKGSRIKNAAMIAFYGGLIISFIFTLIILYCIPENDQYISNSLLVYFPAFNFTFILILALMGVSLNILVLRYFRINYIFIFEIDPKYRLGFDELFKTSLFILTFWVLLLILTFLTINFGLLNHRFYIFPLILICFIIVFIMWPFHCFYYDFRKSLIMALLKNFFPLGKGGVRFRDFMFGDILTSLTRPGASFAISICLLSCQDCREQNLRLNCNRNSNSAITLILMPYVIRLFQCLNRWYYTKMAWPHLGNAIKYCGGIVFNVLSWLYAVHGDEYFYSFLIVASIVNSYMLFWDIYMDWNLGRLSSKNFFLRDKIVYPKSMYWGAIIINSVLRFTWITNIPGLNLGLQDEIKIFILSILEIYRRTQWSLFRIENENTNNPEKYRTILDIPRLPID